MSWTIERHARCGPGGGGAGLDLGHRKQRTVLAALLALRVRSVRSWTSSTLRRLA